MAPLSLVMVCWQTSPFWISIIARVWLKEPIMILELIGMFICFAMVGVIASQAKIEEDEKAAQEGIESSEDGGAYEHKFLGIMFVIVAAIM